MVLLLSDQSREEEEEQAARKMQRGKRYKEGGERIRGYFVGALCLPAMLAEGEPHFFFFYLHQFHPCEPPHHSTCRRVVCLYFKVEVVQGYTDSMQLIAITCMLLLSFIS